MGWYYPRSWIDREDGIEGVVIHYTWTPVGHWPDWGRHHESRVLADAGGFPRMRRKVLRMPARVYDESRGGAVPEYALHSFFEVHQDARELEYVDSDGWITNICIYWGVNGWEAPVYSPMEDPRFPADSEFTSERYYSYWDKDRYHVTKFHMLQQLPLPHRWRARMWGPRGATLVQQYHVGRTYPEHEKFETWLGPDGPGEPNANYWVHPL
jgi:hypothetical protein